MAIQACSLANSRHPNLTWESIGPLLDALIYLRDENAQRVQRVRESLSLIGLGLGLILLAGRQSLAPPYRSLISEIRTRR
jgi:hypothetical protein